MSTLVTYQFVIANHFITLSIPSISLLNYPDLVPFAEDCNVTLDVALWPARYVVRVGKDRPLVVKVMVWGSIKIASSYIMFMITVVHC